MSVLKRRKKIDGFELSDTPEQKAFFKIILSSPLTGDKNEREVQMLQAKMLSEWIVKLNKIMAGEINEYRQE